jgi:hypothetical protein
MNYQVQPKSVQFTEEAEFVLRSELEQLVNDLRAAAAEEAVRTRGIPAEVTGSDMSRVFENLKGRIATGSPTFEVERTSHFAARAERLRLIAEVYKWLGLVSFIGAISFILLPKILGPNLFSDPSTRLSAMIAVGGVFASGLGFALERFVTNKWRFESLRAKLIAEEAERSAYTRAQEMAGIRVVAPIPPITASRSHAPIRVEDEYELKYWARKFEITPDQLRELVRQHGTSPEKIRDALGK